MADAKVWYTSQSKHHKKQEFCKTINRIAHTCTTPFIVARVVRLGAELVTLQSIVVSGIFHRGASICWLT